MKFPHINI